MAKIILEGKVECKKEDGGQALIADDGSHHKAWVIDQIARINNGTPLILKLEKWDDGLEEYRFWTGEPSQEYLDFVKKYKGDWVKSEYYEGWEYSWDEGIPP